MAKETLLESDIAAGARFIEALDNDGDDINAALWLYYPDLLQWKLLLRSARFDTGNITSAYTEVSRVLSKQEEINKNISIGDIKIINPKDPVVKLLKVIIRTGKGLNRIRMRSSLLSGIYIEDALIYRNA
jgi:hypothetical protein